MLTRMLLAATVVAGMSGGWASAHTQAPPPAAQAQAEPATPIDYADTRSWLCRPGRPAGERDACDVDLTTTVVKADGTLTREPFKPNPNASIDCFYVYPTVSTDRSEYSDMNPDAAELNVVRQQAARFASVCRVFAPMYRQVTLAGLRKVLAGNGALDRGTGFDDVRAAWTHYLEHDNKGRGFVLIGHSQGAYVLIELIRQEVDGKPIQSKMVSTLLLGATLTVPKGKDVGGAFKSIPLCRSAAATGCAINYSAFRSTIPPPANSLFGRTTDPSLSGSCTNPAALPGGSGELHAYLDTTGQTITSQPQLKPWVEGKSIDTPWVSVPGLLTAKCATNENATYLEVTVHGNPSDPRVDEITGDIGNPANPSAMWGLHLVDVNLAMGNLIDVVAQQAKAYAKKR